MFRQAIERIVEALDQGGIPYMIIGGQAVLLYGEPRLTRDIDITLGIGPESIDKLIDILASLDLKPLIDDPTEFVRETLVLPCEIPDANIRVDFVFSTSEYERQALNRVNSVSFGNVTVRFAALEDLIIHKIVAGRPRDLEDVKSILRKNQNVDEDYIRLWLRRFEQALARSLMVEYEKLIVII
jgi:predicted nucleotidyltransferase